MTVSFHRFIKDGKLFDDPTREDVFVLSSHPTPRQGPLQEIARITITGKEVEIWSDFLYEGLVTTFGLRSVEKLKR